MNSKISLLIFAILLSANVFGKKNIQISYYDDYFLLNYMEVCVFLCTLFVGIGLIFNYLKKK